MNSGIGGVILGSSNNREKGSDTYTKREGGSHSFWSFKWILGIISSLPQGKYVWDSTKKEFVLAH